MKLIIEDGEGQVHGVPVGRDEISIGREAGNTVQLRERNVSRRHARLRSEGGALWLEDLDSSNGVRVNGARIHAPTPVLPGDLIQIGDYDLGLEGTADQPEAAGATSSSETAVIRAEDVRAAVAAGSARDLPSSEAPRLVCLAGPLRGREYPLRRSIASVGRAAENAVQIDHPSMSRRHCRLELAQGEWKVFDESSANGVRVNGEPYAAATLRPGDLLELGHVRLRFCAPGEPFALPGHGGRGEKRRALTLALGGAAALAVAAGALLSRPSRKPEAPPAISRAAPPPAAPAPAAPAPAPAAPAPAAPAPAAPPSAAPPSAAPPQPAAGAPAAAKVKPAPATAAGRPKVTATREARTGAPAGPSQAARDAAASRAIDEGNARVQAGDYDGAIASFSAAVEQKPAQPVLALAWRGLGIAYVYAGDAKNGVRYFKLYQPFCPASERAQLDRTIARYGG